MTSHSPEIIGYDHPSYASATAGSTSPPDRNRLFSKRGLDFSADEGMPSTYRSLPPPSAAINTSFNNSQRLHEPPPTPTSSLEFLKRSVENAKSAKSAVPIITTTASNGILTTETIRPFPLLRRARADTMPSQSSAFPYSVGDRHSSSTLSLSSLSTASNLSPTLLSPPSTSGTRHRSGSLTLPSASISGAFGPSIFSTSWMDQGREEHNQPQMPPPPTPTTDQLLRDDSSNTIVRTLVSLGLDDDRDTASTPPSIPISNPEIRLPIDLPPRPLMSANRFRSFSVSAAQNYPDTPPESGDSTPTDTGSTASRLLPPVGSSLHHYLHQTSSNRPRAISLGMLDYANNDAFIPPALRALSQSTLGGMSSSLREEIRDDELDQEDVALGNALRNSLGSGDLLGLMVNGYGDGSTSKRSDRMPPGLGGHNRSGSQNMQSIAEMDVQGYGSTGDYGEGLSPYTSPTPDHVGLSSSSPGNQNNSSNNGTSSPSSQTPTRSLWIGNVDPSLTNAELMQLFLPFGQIESLRLLPDKECAFVNFTRVEDAIRAREEIMGRMAGRVGNCVVRVGFGKAEVGVPDAAVMQPTRALWIGNIPTTTTPSALHNLFSPFGTIESARVLTHKNCGFVNFERLEDAARAKKALQNKEALGPGTGAVRIGFAKVPPRPTPSPNPSMTTDSSIMEPPGGRKRFPAPPAPANIPVDANAAAATYHTNMMMMMMAGMGGGAGMSERQMMMQEFGADPDDGAVIDENRIPISYYASIPPIPEPNPNRRLDASRLREIRKRLDNGHATTKEVESIASECMDECVELCSDYIGNTVIQKLFERCNENLKARMLEKIAPYLAAIGVHKNGTWAAQKIIDCAKTPTQIHLITTHLRAYIPPLLLDQFGNYVVQCCLRLGAARNQFIFDAMVDRCWDVAQGRFGARAMRASLESQYVTKRQQKYVAVAIVQNSLLLSTNPNGALLLTWLLDTSALSGRYRVLAPRVAPHLAHLCTHKLASLTILKIINQRQEPDARDLIIGALFYSPNDQVLEEVLVDQVHGVGVVQKVLGSPYVDTYEKQRVAERVKSVLTKLKVQQVQGYKRLLEELSAVLGDGSSATAQASHSPQGLQPPYSETMHPDYAAAIHANYYATQQPPISNGSPDFTNGQSEQTDSAPVATSPSSTPASATLQAPQPHYYAPPQAYQYPAMPGSPFQPYMMMHPQALAAAAAMANMYATHPKFNPASYPYFPVVNGNPNPQLTAALAGQQQSANLGQSQRQLSPSPTPSPQPQPQQTETQTIDVEQQ